MNGEMISDALEFLDEELILQTDEVRRGKRSWYCPPVRGMLAAAACIALVLTGVLMRPKVSMDNAAEMGPMENGAVAEGVLDSEFGYHGAGSIGWELVTGRGFTLALPEGWTLERNQLSHGGNILTLGFDSEFGVCGTGLVEDAVVIAGMEARMGTYDGKDMWDFIVFPGNFVIINASGDRWTVEEQRTIMAILNTLVIEQGVTP